MLFKLILYIWWWIVMKLKEDDGVIMEESNRNNKKIVEELSKEKEILKSILESTADGILVTDNNGTFIEYNDNFCKMWRIAKEVIKTSREKEVLDTVKKQLKYPNKFIKGLKEIEKKGKENLDFIIFKDGRLFERFFRPLMFKGERYGNVWSFRDVTECINLEDELIKNQLLYKKIVNNLPDGILVQKDSKVVLANNVGVSLNGYEDLSQVIGKDIVDLVEFPEDVLATILEDRKEVQTGQNDIKKIEHQIIRKDGRKLDVVSQVFSFNYSGESYLTTIIQDITESKKVKEKLKIKEQIIEKSLNAILYTNLKGNIVYVNDSFLKMWGYDNLNQVVGQDTLELGIWNSAKFVRETRKTLHNKGYWIGETIARSREGIKFDVLLFVNLIKDELGKIIGQAASIINISEIKNTENELKKSREKYKKLLELLPEGVVIIDEGRIAFANKAWAKLLGVEDTKELIGEEENNLLQIHPNYKEIAAKRLKRVIEDRKLSPFLEQKFIRKSDNQILNLELAGIPLIHEDKTAIMSVVRDISERKHFEKELKKNKELYHLLIELLPDAIFLFKEDKVVLANQEALKLINCDNIEEIFGVSFEKLLNGNLIEVHPDYKEDVIKRREKLLKEETSIEFMEEKFILADGSIIDTEVGGVSFFHEDDIYIITVVRDISERKKAEKLQKKIIKEKLKLKEIEEYNKLKTQFFANISHELRTPLNIILCGLQMLDSSKGEKLADLNNSSRLKYRKMIKQNCYRLLRIIGNLIDITKLDVGFLKMNFSNYNIVSVVEDIALSVAQYAATKDINLIFDTEVEEIIIACDLDKIERIILNLLSNAIKFTDPKGFIFVNIYKKSDDVVISIKDTGIGIPKPKLDDIFVRFKQVDESLSRSHEGSGIGLSLVKELVEKHNGTISVDSEYGKGTEFIIELPIKVISKEDGIEQVVNYDKTDEIVEMINIEFSDIYSIDLM